MNIKVSKILIGLGFLFIMNAIFGRYLVLPGYLAGLEQGTATLEGARQVVSVWKIVRYLIWGYSFKLGIYFLILGASFRTIMSPTSRWLFAVGGFIYIGFAFIPLPRPTSLMFGIVGGIMTLFMIFIFLRWPNVRNARVGGQETASDIRLVGFFFFGMATYTLCPLLGVKAFALYPEKMIEFGLQAEAGSFASHLLIELVLGWLFIALSHRQERQ